MVAGGERNRRLKPVATVTRGERKREARGKRERVGFPEMETLNPEIPKIEASLK